MIASIIQNIPGRFYYLTLFFLTVIILSSCSSEKNTETVEYEDSLIHEIENRPEIKRKAISSKLEKDSITFNWRFWPDFTPLIGENIPEYKEDLELAEIPEAQLELLVERPFSENISEYLPKDVSSNYIPLGHRFYDNLLLFIIQYRSESLKDELFLFSYDTVKNRLVDAARIADLGDGSGFSTELKTRWKPDSLLQIIQVRSIEEDVSDNKIKVSTDTLKTLIQLKKYGIISLSDSASEETVEIIDL